MTKILDDLDLDGKLLGKQPYWRFSGGNGQSLTAGVTVTYAPFTGAGRGVTIGSTTVGSVVIQTAGIYTIHFSAFLNAGGTAGVETNIYLERLDASLDRLEAAIQSTNENSSKHLVASAPMLCAVGETVRARIFNGNPGNLNLNGSSTSLFFTGVMVSTL